ncbi:hypothetical protein [Nocardioides sp.]|jgi:hypothetical protein|uniref:hypothetical protein n=1 Tax=Nocardioides sp. TaxID=35761 RepID=UPI00260503F8|nr:hypothetical protein [Nocardioides sp.]
MSDSDKTNTPDTSAPADTNADAGGAPSKGGKRQLPEMNIDVKSVRTTTAKVVWWICLFFALVLAAEVLLIAIEANETNDLVMFLRETAEKVDLGLFSLDDPIKDFNEKVPNFSDTGTALFNYGLAAIAWLVIGRIADAVIRP